MPISYPLDMPSVPGARRVNLFCVSNVSVNRSPYTFISQVQAHPGQIWGAEVTLPSMNRPEAEQWTAWLLKLNGPQGTFKLGDPLGKMPRGIGTNSALVNGAGQFGQSLTIDGLPISTSGVLLTGDYIELEQRLYKVLNDVTSDGSGGATIDIWPLLRNSPADNAVISTKNCKGLFRLTQTTNPVYSADENSLFEFSFSCIEAL